MKPSYIVSVVSRSIFMALLAVILAILTVSPAHASSISVPNASFESPTSPASTSTNPALISGWVFNVKGGSVYGTLAASSNFISAGTSTGNDAAFINNDYPGVTDTITSASSLGTIAPLTEYTLTLAIGNVKGSDSSLYNAPGNVSFSLLANGVAFATETINNGSVTNGTFQDFTLTYTTPASASIIGENLQIQMASLPEQSSAYKPVFDNVRLEATALDPQVVPEPSSWALLLSGLLMLGWMIRRQDRLAHSITRSARNHRSAGKSPKVSRTHCIPNG